MEYASDQPTAADWANANANAARDENKNLQLRMAELEKRVFQLEEALRKYIF